MRKRKMSAREAIAEIEPEVRLERADAPGAREQETGDMSPLIRMGAAALICSSAGSAVRRTAPGQRWAPSPNTAALSVSLRLGWLSGAEKRALQPFPRQGFRRDVPDVDRFDRRHRDRAASRRPSGSCFSILPANTCRSAPWRSRADPSLRSWICGRSSPA